MTGAIYSVRVGVSNKAGVTTIHETNGITLDLTKPVVCVQFFYLFVCDYNLTFFQMFKRF